VGDEMISAGEVVRSITSATSASFNERIVINAASNHEARIRLAESEAVPLALVII
jgi:hypothetical protein